MNYYVYVRNNESEVRSQTLANIEKERIKRKITQRKSGIPKWTQHGRYNKFPNSESELVEFLKEVQRESK